MPCQGSVIENIACSKRPQKRVAVCDFLLFLLRNRKSSPKSSSEVRMPDQESMACRWKVLRTSIINTQKLFNVCDLPRVTGEVSPGFQITILLFPSPPPTTFIVPLLHVNPPLLYRILVVIANCSACLSLVVCLYRHCFRFVRKECHRRCDDIRRLRSAGLACRCVYQANGLRIVSLLWYNSYCLFVADRFLCIVICSIDNGFVACALNGLTGFCFNGTRLANIFRKFRYGRNSIRRTEERRIFGVCVYIQRRKFFSNLSKLASKQIIRGIASHAVYLL